MRIARCRMFLHLTSPRGNLIPLPNHKPPLLLVVEENSLPLRRGGRRHFDRFDGYLDGSGMFCPMSTDSAPDCLKYASQNSVTFRCSATVSGRRSFVAPRPTPAMCTSAFLRAGINLSLCNMAISRGTGVEKNFRPEIYSEFSIKSE